MAAYTELKKRQQTANAAAITGRPAATTMMTSRRRA
jgi:hypothetical protein